MCHVHQAECPLNNPLGNKSTHNSTHMFPDINNICISLVGAIDIGKKLFDGKIV